MDPAAEELHILMQVMEASILDKCIRMIQQNRDQESQLPAVSKWVEMVAEVEKNTAKSAESTAMVKKMENDLNEFRIALQRSEARCVNLEQTCNTLNEKYDTTQEYCRSKLDGLDAVIQKKIDEHLPAQPVAVQTALPEEINARFSRYDTTMGSLQANIAGINTTLQTTTGKINARFSRYDTTMGSLQANIAGINTTLQTTTGKINASFSQYDDNMVNLQADIAEINTKLQTTAGEINTQLDNHNTKIRELHANTDDINIKLQAITARINTKLQTDTDEISIQLQTATDDIDTKLLNTIGYIEAKLQAATDDINTKLRTTADDNSTQLQTATNELSIRLQDTVEEFGVKFSEYETNIRELKTSTVSITTTLRTYDTNIRTLQSYTGDINNRLGECNSDINILRSDLKSLNESVSVKLADNIEKLQYDLNSLKVDTTALDRLVRDSVVGYLPTVPGELPEWVQQTVSEYQYLLSEQVTTMEEKYSMMVQELIKSNLQLGELQQHEYDMLVARVEDMMKNIGEQANGGQDALTEALDLLTETRKAQNEINVTLNDPENALRARLQDIEARNTQYLDEMQERLDTAMAGLQADVANVQASMESEYESIAKEIDNTVGEIRRFNHTNMADIDSIADSVATIRRSLDAEAANLLEIQKTANVQSEQIAVNMLEVQHTQERVDDIRNTVAKMQYKTIEKMDYVQKIIDEVRQMQSELHGVKDTADREIITLIQTWKATLEQVVERQDIAIRDTSERMEAEVETRLAEVVDRQINTHLQPVIGYIKDIVAWMDNSKESVDKQSDERDDPDGSIDEVLDERDDPDGSIDEVLDERDTKTPDDNEEGWYSKYPIP